MHVAIADIDDAAADSVRKEIEALGVKALVHRTDVVKREELEALAETVYGEFGAAHVLCNNAGVVTFGPIDETTDHDWRWVLAVNLEGVVNGLQAFLPRMRKQTGEKHVVNTASIAGLYPHEGITPYVAAKYAVVGISENLHLEGKPHGIGCSVLCPGNVNTQIVAAGRNRPDSAGGPDHTEYPEVQELIDKGMDPLEVGRIVRRAVLDNELYILTHSELRVEAEKRFKAILRGFDRAAK
jgi:NAD(P)-dependent dehydrogenase (short-subunit alcohol dehydrogenase family)